MKSKEIVKYYATMLAISFFFASLFICLVYLLFRSDIYYYSSVINSSFTYMAQDNGNTVYDEESKRIIKYPEYNKRYAYIDIPKIDMHMPLYNGDTLDILLYGAGQYVGSYFPGEGGTTLIAGHNNKGYFRRIDELRKGDVITIDADYGTFTYVIDSYEVVKKTDLDKFLIQDNKERLILYTCYPIRKSVIGRRTERYVVYAFRE